MGSFSILLDAPAAPVSRMQLAEIGDGFKDPRYGEFAITTEEVQDWAKNLSALPGGRALIDEDHRSDKPSPHRDTEASGWITNITLEDDKVIGDVHWTPKGEAALKEERYLFFSPAFGKFTNEKGEEFEHTLTGGALTNKPFLTQMPMVTLASAPRLLEAGRQSAEHENASFTLDQAYEQGITVLDISQEMREKHAVVVKEIDGKKMHMFPIPPGDKKHARAALSLLPAAIKAGHINSSEAAEVRARAEGVLGKKEMSDSRPQMKFTADILKTLGITDEDIQKKILEAADADNADAAKVAEMIAQAQAEAGGSNGETAKTLEQQAAADGKVILSAAQYSEMVLAAADKGSSATKPSLKDSVSSEFLTTLGIEDGETQKKILDLAGQDDTDLPKLFGAIDSAKGAPAAAKAAADTKTLEQQAAAEGKVLLDSTQLAQLTLDATAGAEAKKELAETTFENKFDENVRKGKMAPAMKEQMHGFYQLDAAGTLKLMDEAPQILNVKPQGANVKPPDENMPDGVHQEGYELETKVRTFMAEHNEASYIKALEAVTGVTVGA